MASELKLEVGKFYRSADGRKIGPMEKASLHGTFRGPGAVQKIAPHLHQIYNDDGSVHAQIQGEQQDALIAEWTDAPTGPVRTVTRKEIVPGMYGGVEVTHVDYATEAHGANVCIRIDNGFGPDSLRAAIATLTEIADALEANQ